MARGRPMSIVLTRWLAGIFLLGGAGRLLSLAVWGRPHWFQLALATEATGGRDCQRIQPSRHFRTSLVGVLRGE